MKHLIFLFSLFTALSASAQNKPITVAVIDTGFGYMGVGQQASLCKTGHKDFTKDKKFSTNYGTVDPVPVDFHGHGTNIAGLINIYATASSTKFCMVIIKIYPGIKGNGNDFDAAGASADAINYARQINAKVINYSGGGSEISYRENHAVTAYLDAGGTLVAAAGNDGLELGKYVNYYPAMSDKRVIIVGNKRDNGVRETSSNFGPLVTRWEFGVNQEAFGITFTGTSQATAVATGKIVSELKNKYDTTKKNVANKKIRQ